MKERKKIIRLQRQRHTFIVAFGLMQCTYEQLLLASVAVSAASDAVSSPETVPR